MVDGIVKTPRYVLKETTHSTCPTVVQAAAGAHSVVINGFSDSPEQDVSLSGCSWAWTRS